MADVLFEEARLAELYDAMCVGRDDTAYYSALASRLEADLVVDLGCGTGVLALELAARGHRVIGVDPATGMLSVARSRPGAEAVEWRQGDASVLGDEGADLLVMNGHVAQVFRDQADWRVTLVAAHRALVDGGRIAFEFRNPAARAWERWNPVDSREVVVHPVEGPVTAWVETTHVDPEHVTFVWTYAFEETAAVLRSTSRLWFPSREVVEETLRSTGFVVEDVHGDWSGRPATEAAPEMIFVAVRRDG